MLCSFAYFPSISQYGQHAPSVYMCTGNKHFDDPNANANKNDEEQNPTITICVITDIALPIFRFCGSKGIRAIDYNSVYLFVCVCVIIVVYTYR